VKRPAEQIPDSNAIIRYLLGDHPSLFPKAEEFFARVRTGEQRALILEGVIAETVSVLTKAYGVPREKAASGLMGLLNYRGVSNADRAFLYDALALFRSGKLDIVDCLVIARARRENCEPFPLAGNY
jgi:predicted nucleic-acid-binding protein